MAKELSPLSIVGPGSLGLNTKSSSLEIGPEYCTTTTNAVVANTGVLAARKGFVAQNATEIAMERTSEFFTITLTLVKNQELSLLLTYRSLKGQLPLQRSQAQLLHLQQITGSL